MSTITMSIGFNTTVGLSHNIFHISATAFMGRSQLCSNLSWGKELCHCVMGYLRSNFSSIHSTHAISNSHQHSIIGKHDIFIGYPMTRSIIPEVIIYIVIVLIAFKRGIRIVLTSSIRPCRHTKNYMFCHYFLLFLLRFLLAFFA